MGVSENGGFPQQPFGFPTKNDHFGGVLGVPPFKETPMYIYIYNYAGSCEYGGFLEGEHDLNQTIIFRFYVSAFLGA